MFDISSITHQESAGKSLGALLADARKAKGLAIEEAAIATRIRAQRLREIEQDDFSQFVHPSYARLFLVDYAKYLGIPFQNIRAILPDGGTCGSGGYQYLTENPGGDTVRAVRPVRSRRRLMPVLVATGLLVVCVFGGFRLWVVARNIDRLGIGHDKIAQMDASAVDLERRVLGEAKIVNPPSPAAVLPAVPVHPPEVKEPAVPLAEPQWGADSAAIDDHALLFMGKAIGPGVR